jgi:hypothetical protein
MLFNPSQTLTTLERTGGNAEAKTEQTLETAYWIESEDSLYLGLSQFSLERGGFGDAKRDVVRLNAGSEQLSEAVIACVRTQYLLANDETASDYARKRSQEFLDRLGAIFGAELTAR